MQVKWTFGLQVLRWCTVTGDYLPAASEFKQPLGPGKKFDDPELQLVVQAEWERNATKDQDGDVNLVVTGARPVSDVGTVLGSYTDLQHSVRAVGPVSRGVMRFGDASILRDRPDITELCMVAFRRSQRGGQSTIVHISAAVSVPKTPTAFNGECPVCTDALGDVSSGQCEVWLCGHAMHLGCAAHYRQAQPADKRLSWSLPCPICRRTVVADTNKSYP